MASSQQKQEQQSKSTGWGPAMSQIEGSLPQVGQLYNQRLGQSFFPGQTYAGFDPSQSEALGNIEGIARGGGGVTGDALNLTRDTLQGKYLDAGNPHSGLMAGRTRDQVLPSITSQWAKAGRGTGNLGVVDAATQGLGDSIGAGILQGYTRVITLALSAYVHRRGQRRAGNGQQQRQSNGDGIFLHSRSPDIDTDELIRTRRTEAAVKIG